MWICIKHDCSGMVGDECPHCATARLLHEEKERLLKSLPVELPVILQGELLPCPFCGEDEWEKLGETYFLQHNYDCFIRNTSEPLISKTILRNNTESIWWNKRAGREPQSK